MLKLTSSRAGALAAASGICGALWALAPAGYALAQSSSSSDEIVVTAQRRAERQVDVPITVTTVSGNRLESAGVEATANLGQVVPAFRLDYNGAFAQPSIRGVSTALANVGGGSSVGVYIDGFYNPSPLTSDFGLLNVASVQVLKGPQGTLFGRNTTAGAVLVQTSDPTQDLTFHAHASYGNYNASEASFYISGGVMDNLAVDFAAQYSRGDGYITNLATHDDTIGEYENSNFRVGAKLDLNSTDYLLLRYTHNDRDDPMSVDWSVYKDRNGVYEAAVPPGSIFGRTQGEIGTNYKPVYASRLDQLTLTGKFDVGFANLTTLSMYRHELSFHDIDVDASNADLFRVSFHNRDKTLTQEILLNSKPNGGPLTWVAGFFYMNQTAGQPNFQIDSFGGFNAGYQYTTHINIESYALFLDATYQLAEKWFLTAGGRYSYESDDGYWFGCPGPTCLSAPPGLHSLANNWEDFSPRLVARYQINDHSNLYASWTQGFKAGLMNVNGFQTDPIAPESIQAFEVGYKYAQGGTRLELSTFYYDYTDLQVSNYIGVKSVTTNAASSEVYGVELSGSHRLTDNFTVSGGLAWNHGRYETYLTAPANNFDPLAGIVNTPSANVSGNHMIRSPDLTGNLALDYTIPVGGGELDLNGNVYYSDKVFFDAANHNEQPAYTLLSLHASWLDPSHHWTFGVWGNNVTDEAYITQVLPNATTASVSWGAPATYGVSIDYRY